MVWGCNRLNGMSRFVYKLAHGWQIRSAKQKKEEEDMGTCGPKLLMGARRHGAVGSILKLNPTLMHCSAFTWSPKLEEPLAFMDKKTFQKRNDSRILLKFLGL